MSEPISAGSPLEPQRFAVGRRSALVVDDQRDGRVLAIDCWFPACSPSSEDRVAAARSVYELLPGVGFTASALSEAEPLAGEWPLILWSHGRTGTRSAYVMLCEGLAARGNVVVSCDHPGDTLLDWMMGAAVDDVTNETQRCDDVAFVLDGALGVHDGCAELLEGISVDGRRVAIAGHSYGGNTALRYASRVETDSRVHAIAGLQSFTRTIPRADLGRVSIPTLLIAGARDVTCPVDTDADRAFAAIMSSRDVCCVVIAAAGHQACSDVGLYKELAPHVPNLPEMVVDYLSGMGSEVTGDADDPWRPCVALHLELLGTWLNETLSGESAPRTFDTISQGPGISRSLRRTL